MTLTNGLPYRITLRSTHGKWDGDSVPVHLKDRYPWAKQCKIGTAQGVITLRGVVGVSEVL